MFAARVGAAATTNRGEEEHGDNAADVPHSVPHRDRKHAAFSLTQGMSDEEKLDDAYASRYSKVPGGIRVQSLLGEEEAEERRRADAESDAAAPVWQMRALRRKLRDLLEDPSSSVAAYCIAVIILVMIILSSLSFMAETIEKVVENDSARELISTADWVFIGCFTTEYLLRLYASTNPVSFVIELPNIIDLVAILPSYIELLMGSTQIDLRFLRLARVFRVFKLSRYGNKMQMVVDALAESKDILAMLAVNLAIIIILFSSIMYFIEKDWQDIDKETGEIIKTSKFTSIPATCWWCIVTVLTVGYGDMYPETELGMIIAALLMIVSLIVLALPITIIGSCFSNQWVAWKEDQKLLDRLAALPKQVQILYPPLTKLADEIADHNSMMRSHSIETARLNELLKEDTNKNNEQKMQVSLNKMKLVTDSLILQLDEKFAQEAYKFYEVIAQIHERGTETESLRTNAREVLDEARVTMRSALSRLVAHKASFDRGVRDLSKYSCIAMVHLVGGKDLVAKDITGTSDPFVIVSQGREEVKSKHVKSSLSPLWDEHLCMLIQSRTDPMSITVWDHDQFSSHDLMGSAGIGDLQDMPLRQPQRRWLDLSGVGSTGKVLVVVTLHEFADVTSEDLSSPNLYDGLKERLLTLAKENEGEFGGAARTHSNPSFHLESASMST